MIVFVDAGGWLSVLIESDQYHEIGSRYWQSLISACAAVTTTDFVLDEVITRLRYDIGHRKAKEFIALVHEAMEAGVLTVHRITEDLWNEAEAIFLRYKDVKLSFTDCTSFALLHKSPADEVFGYDTHFEMMGHLLQPKP